MDSPEAATEITLPSSKIEDSPFFSFVNSLSPITQVKSVRISHAYQSISFTSPPAIFTSPHANQRKDLSTQKDKEVVAEDCQMLMKPLEMQKVIASVLPVGQVPVNLSANPQKNFKFDSNSSSGQSVPLRSDSSVPPVNSTRQIDAPDSSLNGLHQTRIDVSEVDVDELYSTMNSKDASDCDWEILMPICGLENTNMWIFNSPVNTEAVVCTSFHKERKMQIDNFSMPAEATKEDISAQQALGDGPYKADQLQESENNQIEFLESCLGVEEDDKEANLSSPMGFPNSNRAMRRCLNFENSGAAMKPLLHTAASSSSTFLPPDSHDRDAKRIPDQSRCIIPGIGLHLNSLAITSKENKNIKIESISSPMSFTEPHSFKISDEVSNLASVEAHPCKIANADFFLEESSQAGAYASSEEPNTSSPKKKRRKFEGEGDACKRCNCKKSKCLKLYCECFAAGVYCIEPCSCQGCFNNPRHEDTVLATRKQIESRNPLAFAPKVIRNTESVSEVGDQTTTTPASARHKRGCNCKKSNCLKKYCECFQGGVGCSIGCRCEGCKNTYGRKDETVPADEAKMLGEEQTPSSLERASVPFQSALEDKQRRSVSIGSSSGSCGKPCIILTQPEEIPAILRSAYSPSSAVKSSSPNSKRVSPPQTSLGPSRSGRKLILQSIPSFPSLAHN